ncbi:ABC transporter permease [Calidifontibacter sp. DB0510]|uniref:Transport permease protein n=1 Tax=Metallococcus carri TaxID=1656884 RepID=A0A967B1A4_9MICO|nr:ABC transporter permease [Metallococcus carri]NHN56468.1 ABC transporter permease [Metallococcus carri]NOP36092.1 ABC transporter permease [Calidifontibacter sp. DB2511S]
MNPHATIATIKRILLQLRADHRTVGLIVGVPTLLLTLLYFVYNGSAVFDRLALTMLGILPMLVMFLVTSVAMLRERTTGTLERLLTTPLHRADLLLGYGIAFAVAALAQSLVIVAVAHWLLGVDTAGPLAWVLLVAICAATVGVATGLLASAFARTEFQAVQFMPLVIGPQVFLCGLLAPRDGMPELLRWLSDALPMTYAVKALQAIGRQSDPTTDVMQNAGVLLAFTVVALGLAAGSMPRRTR